MSEKHDDVTSSKVSLHPKENELEELCSLSKMSLSETTVSPQGNIEGETKEVIKFLEGKKVLKKRSVLGLEMALFTNFL